MNPYAPLFSNPVDVAVAWVAVGAWLFFGATALRRRFAAAPSRSERVCSAVTSAFLVLVIAIMALFAVGLVFFAWLKISSVFWGFWQLFYLMSVVCVFWVLPLFAVGLTCWALVGRWWVGFSARCLKLASASVTALLIDAGLYFWLCYVFAREAA
jgi:hypothetical protein